MKLVSKDSQNKLNAPTEIILGESADYYIGYETHSHTFRTYDKEYWDVADFGAKPGDKIEIRI